MSLLPQVRNHRIRRGVGAAELADRVGISRQALSAIESGRSAPSTAVALRLARELGCRVEDLFGLPTETLAELALPDGAGSRVSLGRVSGRWVAHLVGPGEAHAADAVVDDLGRVELLDDRAAIERRILVAGCAPVLGVLADRVPDVTWLQAPSRRALTWLAEGRVHIAGMHLADLDDPEVHDRLARETVGGELQIVRLVGWREGIATAAGNPLQLQGAADLLRPGLRVAQRPAGSGAARVLDRVLDGQAVQGIQAATHTDAAQAVRFGAADAAVLVEPLAAALGLPFVPLSEERFELVVRAGHLDHPGVQRFLDALTHNRFAREVRGMGAYDLQGVGAARRVG